MKPKEE